MLLYIPFTLKDSGRRNMRRWNIFQFSYLFSHSRYIWIEYNTQKQLNYHLLHEKQKNGSAQFHSLFSSYLLPRYSYQRTIPNVKKSYDYAWNFIVSFASFWVRVSFLLCVLNKMWYNGTIIKKSCVCEGSNICSNTYEFYLGNEKVYYNIILQQAKEIKLWKKIYCWRVHFSHVFNAKRVSFDFEVRPWLY